MGKRKPPDDKPVTPIHVFADEMAELAAVLRPWAIWLPLIFGAILLRQFWPDNQFVVGFLGLAAVMVPVLIWAMEKELNIAFFVHSILSGLFIAGVLSVVDILGYAGHHYLGLFLLLFGIPLLCITWSVRGAIHEKQLEQTTHFGEFFEKAGTLDDGQTGTRGQFPVSLQKRN